MTKLTIALLTLGSINAMALDCYSDKTCSRVAIGLVKKSAKKKICTTEAKSALQAIKQKNYDGAATNALDACLKALKGVEDIKELESALK